MIKKIVVPLDGSELAEGILPHVKEIASRTGAEMVLLTSVVDVGVWDATVTAALLGKEEELAGAYLDAKAGELRAAGFTVRARVLQGPAAEAILGAAREEAASLIAISTHGRSGLSRWIFGSVAVKIVQSTDRPLLVVRPAEKAPASAQIRKILVPLDGSDVAEAVLPFVEELANAVGAAVVLFNAIPPLAAYPGFETAQPVLVGRVIEEMQDDARKLLTRVAKEMEGRGVTASMVVTVALAVDGIIHAAEETGADLIALGTHGRSGLGRMVLGSVADGVIRRSTVPCLLVNPKGLPEE